MALFAQERISKALRWLPGLDWIIVGKQACPETIRKSAPEVVTPGLKVLRLTLWRPDGSTGASLPARSDLNSSPAVQIKIKMMYDSSKAQ